MKNTNSQFNIEITAEENFLLVVASGNYSLKKATNLFKLAIDNGLSLHKSKILIDVTNIAGSIPLFDRFQYSEFLSTYSIKHALGKINRIAVVGQEPIVHNGRFGETVAVNRGANVKIFTDMSKAFIWLNKELQDTKKDVATNIPEQVADFTLVVMD